jgi:carboxylesterase type B
MVIIILLIEFFFSSAKNTKVDDVGVFLQFSNHIYTGIIEQNKKEYESIINTTASITTMIMVKALALVLLVSSITPLVIANNNSMIAQTQQGIYIGGQTTVNDTNVNYWYGIPYAQQPIGNLRWMPPQALAASTGTNTALIPNACPQSTNYGVPLTESCLTLNVYAPENATNLPVYVWIHGGSFTGGAGILYSATEFVSTSIINSVPVVVVTINYRLGLLGFLADEALYDERSGVSSKSTTGNYGILDQMMALDWIKKNIHGFGGNPEQITVGGESAGGISVTILLTSPLVTSGTFQRVIIQSGNIWPNVTSPLQDAIHRTGNILRFNVSCATVQCLRNLTVDQILKVQNIIASQNIFGQAATPVIDGYVLDDIMENSYAKGAFQKVPILIGSNTNETSFFTCPIFNGSANIAQVQTFFNTAYNTTIASEIPDIYGPISNYDNPLTYLNIVYSDSWGHCGTRRIASKFSSYGSSAYFYTYNHLISVTLSCFGVAHGAEIPMLFPSILPFLYPNYTFTALEQQLSTNMILYWANFIHKSDPNYSGSPAIWEAYLASSDNNFVIDINPQMRYIYYSATCSRFWDQYAVTNHPSTSSAMRYNNKTSLIFIAFLLFVSQFMFAFI